MGYFVGVDVGLRSSSLCIIDEQGKVCLERVVASEIDEIADAIRGFADKRVRTIAHDDPICQLLMSAPGVGFVAALTFKAAVDDPKRFRRSKTVAAHFGLTPRRYQSGEKDNPGHISKAGDVEVRSALFLAANSIMNGRGQTSSLRQFGARLARKSRKRAMVAVARKLAVLLHAMWTDGTMFCNVEKEALA